MSLVRLLIRLAGASAIIVGCAVPTATDRANYRLVQNEINDIDLPEGTFDEHTDGEPAITEGSAAQTVRYERSVRIEPERDSIDALRDLVESAATNGWVLVAVNCEHPSLTFFSNAHHFGFAASIEQEEDRERLLSIRVSSGPSESVFSSDFPPIQDASCLQ